MRGKVFTIAIAIAACSTAYSSEDTPNDAGDGSPPLDAAPKQEEDGGGDSSLMTDGDPVSLDATGGDGGAGTPFATFSFDNVATCDPWIVGPNTTATAMSGGFTGNACRVCSPAAGGSRIYVNLDGRGAGGYRASLKLKSESYVGAVSLEMRFQGEGGTVIGGNTTTPPNSSMWKDLTVRAMADRSYLFVVIVVTAYDGAGCILLDDATVTFEQ